uniref:Uncharacterized protein n=1 Tax=Amphimedon queenslandica TaxID=400682 RepID=A0A1X7V9J1_AMPQE
MIDVSQWRASIGLWNYIYCQAASSRPANGRHSHSFKAAGDSKSGDVELNPGPMIDDRPDISLLIQWLEPLVDWKPFGLGLPGITYSDISKIEAELVRIDERNLIVDMTEVFLQDFKFGNEYLVLSKLKNYKKKADKLRFSAQVKHLNEALKEIYGEHILDTSNVPTIILNVKDHRQKITLSGL